MKKIYYIFLLLFSVTSLNCSAFFYKHKKINQNFEVGKFQKAKEILNSKKGIKASGKDRLLNLIYNGIILHMQKKYNDSNLFLEQAYQRIRNYRSNKVRDTFALIISPISSDYMGEDPEILIVNYYKALNYLAQNNMELALQECRRMDLALRMMRQKYKEKALYRKDAFLYLFMGLIYEANYEYNNAFLCYKNAVLVYDNDYKNNFGINIPEQLKEDLFRMAYLEGFMDEIEYFEKIFKTKYIHNKNLKKNLIILWNNGLGPFKDSLDIVFAVNPAVGGLINFKNEEQGLNFTFPIPPTQKKASVFDTNFFKISFPKYVSRAPYYTDGEIIVDGNIFKLELIEDFNKICIASLRQRMVWEFGKILLRLFFKKIVEHKVSNINAAAGFVTNIFNTVTEIPDTRCVSILPSKIHYARVELKSSSKNSIFYRVYKKNKERIEPVNYDVAKDNINFLVLYTLETKK